MKNPCTRRTLRLALAPVACATLLAACASYPVDDPVYGSAPVDTYAATFERHDVNRDGFLSRAEAEAIGVRSHAVSAESATAAFHRLDTNGDGFLSRAEAEATLAGIPGASFEASDADRDGFLFGRGVSDNKGNLMARLQAIEAYREAFGELPLRVRVLFEGEVEIGSPHLGAFVDAHADALRADDVGSR